MDPHFLGGQKWGKKEPRDDNKEVDNGYDPPEGGRGGSQRLSKKEKKCPPHYRQGGGGGVSVTTFFLLREKKWMGISLTMLKIGPRSLEGPTFFFRKSCESGMWWVSFYEYTVVVSLGQKVFQFYTHTFLISA